jgi:cytochrome c peroxidase
MKKRVIAIVSIFTVAFIVSGLMTVDSGNPVKKATAGFISQKKVLENKTSELSALLNEYMQTGQITKDSIKKKLLECRIAYKKIEWAIAYYYPTVATRINGTDVMEEEEPSEFEPAHGMQTIENIVLQENPPDVQQAARLKDELMRLHITVVSLTEAISFLSGTSNSELLAALKYELIKVTTLGFTEYDNPVMKNYLVESIIALNSIHDNLKLFDKLVSPPLLIKTDSLFAAATKFIQKNKNLDKFNRLEFITEHYTALSKVIDEYARELNITYTSYNPNIDLTAKSIFDLKSFSYFLISGDKTNQAARVNLGRTLFFDPVLSGNYKRACASCHKPEKTFTDGLSKSMAYESNQFVGRNAPTIINACLQVSFFDDSREASLEGQIAAVINNPKELNNNFTTIITRLEQSKEYAILFEKAFPGQGINASLIKQAIADFEKTLVGFNSDFDKYLKGDKKRLNASQINGFNLFMGKAKCGSCHFFPLFNGVIPPLYNSSEFEILGTLETNNFKHPRLDMDEGVVLIKKGADHLKFGFKVPGLRNAALTAPYMHNGAMKTLLEVMTFYNKGGAAGFDITIPNQTLSHDALGLNKQQINDIIHFIESLTDTTGLMNPPLLLPKLSDKDKVNERVVGGEY